MRKINVPAGTRFDNSRLTVIAEVEPRAKPSGQLRRMVACLCDCGKETVVELYSLRSGNTTSCGCFNRRRSSFCNTKHGMTNHPVYRIWASMIKRCVNRNTRYFMNYGGRGIYVCEQWKDAATFMQWALDNGWQAGLELDRRDNDGPYCPGNCRIVTRADNQRNKRNNRRLTYNGETRVLAEWAELINMSVQTLHSRLSSGWSVDRALSTPVQRGTNEQQS